MCGGDLNIQKKRKMRQIHCQKERGKQTQRPKESCDLKRQIRKIELPPPDTSSKDTTTVSDTHESSTHQVPEDTSCSDIILWTNTLRGIMRHTHLYITTPMSNISISFLKDCGGVHFHNYRHKWRKDAPSLVLWAKRGQNSPMFTVLTPKILLAPFCRKAH